MTRIRDTIRRMKLVRGKNGMVYKMMGIDYSHSFNEPGWPVEPRMCKVFGCGQILTIQEQLFGDYCIFHSGEKLETVNKKFL